jgi:hypothetical protein
VQYVSDCRKYARLERFGTLPPERRMEHTSLSSSLQRQERWNNGTHAQPDLLFKQLKQIFSSSLFD